MLQVGGALPLLVVVVARLENHPVVIDDAVDQAMLLGDPP